MSNRDQADGSPAAGPRPRPRPRTGRCRIREADDEYGYAVRIAR